MKKAIALLLATVLLFSLAACGEKPDGRAYEQNSGDRQTVETAAEPAEESDLAYVTGKGTLLVGVAVNAPMNYKNDKGEWIGFDSDMAKTFADNLGVKAEFVEIDMENKEKLLEDKTVDCIWSAMELTADNRDAMACSAPYCDNGQVVIVAASAAKKYQTVEDCKYLRFAAEAGSAGEAELNARGYAVTAVKKQAAALASVKQGTADAAVVDAVVAAAVVGKGTAYEELTYTAHLSREEFGVGFRKGSNLTYELGIFLAAAYADGFTQKVAERYGVQAALLPQNA